MAWCLVKHRDKFTLTFTIQNEIQSTVFGVNLQQYISHKKFCKLSMQTKYFTKSCTVSSSLDISDFHILNLIWQLFHTLCGEIQYMWSELYTKFYPLV